METIHRDPHHPSLLGVQARDQTLSKRRRAAARTTGDPENGAAARRKVGRPPRQLVKHSRRRRRDRTRRSTSLSTPRMWIWTSYRVASKTKTPVGPMTKRSMWALVP